MDAKPDSRTRILESATDVFRLKGYSSTRVEDICAAAGLTKGGFFHHFASKEQLAIAAAEHWSDVTGGLFRDAEYHRHADPVDRLLGYIEFRKVLLGGTLAEFTCLLGTLVQEVYETNPSIRIACDISMTGHIATLMEDFAEARRRYAPDAEWTAESLALHTQAVMQGAFILAKAKGSAEVAADCIDHLSRYVAQLFHRQPLELKREREDA